MASKKEEELTFESAMEELQNITQSLEKGNLSLTESIDLFEQGTKLIKHCNDCLEKAEAKITVLVKNERGDIVEEDFAEKNKEQ